MKTFFVVRKSISVDIQIEEANAGELEEFLAELDSSAQYSAIGDALSTQIRETLRNAEITDAS